MAANGPADGLLVSGRRCKLFYDQEMHEHYALGGNLLPWPPDKGATIDRFDARSMMHKLPKPSEKLTEKSANRSREHISSRVNGSSKKHSRENNYDDDDNDNRDLESLRNFERYRELIEAKHRSTTEGDHLSRVAQRLQQKLFQKRKRGNLQRPSGHTAQTVWGDNKRQFAAYGSVPSKSTGGEGSEESSASSDVAPTELTDQLHQLHCDYGVPGYPVIRAFSRLLAEHHRLQGTKRRLRAMDPEKMFPQDPAEQHKAQRKLRRETQKVDADLLRNERARENFSIRQAMFGNGSRKKSGRGRRHHQMLKEAPALESLKRYLLNGSDEKSSESSSKTGSDSGIEQFLVSNHPSTAARTKTRAKRSSQMPSKSTSSCGGSSSSSNKRTESGGSMNGDSTRKLGAAEKLRMLMRQKLTSQSQKAGEAEKKKRKQIREERRKRESNIRNLERRRVAANSGHRSRDDSSSGDESRGTTLRRGSRIRPRDDSRSPQSCRRPLKVRRPDVGSTRKSQHGERHRERRRSSTSGSDSSIDESSSISSRSSADSRTSRRRGWRRRGNSYRR